MTMWDCQRCGGTLTCYCPPQPTKKEEAMTEFDPSKPVMTRDGRKARIICQDRFCVDASLDKFPIVGLVGDDESGTESVYAYSQYGIWVGKDSRCDLVNIPESKWMNLYDGPEADRIASCWRESRASADGVAELRAKDSAAKRVAIVEWTASGEFITTAVEK